MLQVLPKIIIKSVPVGNYYQILEVHLDKTVVVDEYCTNLQQAKNKYFSWKYAKSNKDYEFIYDSKNDEYILAKKYGYHTTSIAKGKIGEPSKIYEEVEEFKDAIDQGIEVMAILELADLLGAVECYLEEHHPTIKLEDLIRMKNVTRRAFSNGFRN